MEKEPTKKNFTFYLDKMSVSKLKKIAQKRNRSANNLLQMLIDKCN